MSYVYVVALTPLPRDTISYSSSRGSLRRTAEGEEEGVISLKFLICDSWSGRAFSFQSVSCW
jgi:hypothetical protein